MLIGLTLQCTYAQLVWLEVTTRLGVPGVVPSSLDCISDWWPEATAAVRAADRKSANSLIMLIMRGLWFERNTRVFVGKSTAATVTASTLVDGL